MKNKFKLLSSIILYSLLFTLIACSDSVNNDNTSTESAEDNGDAVGLGELTIGLMPAIDSFPIVLADYLGYFEDEGLTVRLEPFSSSAYRDAALQAGELDAATVDLVAVGLFVEADFPIRATGVTGGHFILVSEAGFYSIEDLTGESVVISSNTAIDFVLDQMIQIAGFELDHIERVIVPPVPERMELLRGGQVTAALLPEPWATIAIADGFYEITNTVEIGLFPFVTAFTDEVLENQPADVQAFYRAYNRAIDFINATPLEEYFHIMVDVIGFPEDVIDHLILPEFPHNQMPADDVLSSTIDWLLARELVSENMTIDDLINTVAFD